MIRHAFLLCLCWVLGTLVGAAQDDRPWWKSLFKGQAVQQEVPSVEPEPVPVFDSVEPNAVEGDESRDGKEEPVEVVFLEQEGIFGSAQWSITDEVAALDSAQVDPKAIRIPGYRVQLFMGRLDSARSLRRHLLQSERLQHAVYVTPYPPLFGVTTGNFTSPLAAHRVREGLLHDFPQSLVVPLSLPLDAIYPESPEGAQGPQLQNTHRD